MVLICVAQNYRAIVAVLVQRTSGLTLGQQLIVMKQGPATAGAVSEANFTQAA